jgi:hypothetical protein
MKQRLSSRNLPCCSKKSLGALTFLAEPEVTLWALRPRDKFRPFDGDRGRADQSATGRGARCR